MWIELEGRCRQGDDSVEVEGRLVIVPEISVGREEEHRSVAVRVVMRLVHDHDVPVRAPDLAQESGCLPLLLLDEFLVDNVEAWRNLVAAIYSLSADTGVPKFPRRGTIVDAANLVPEQLTGRVARRKISREATACARRARFLFPFANKRGLAQHERAFERSASVPSVRAEVREHCKSLIRLAESDLVGEHDPSLSMDEEASQGGGDDTLLLLVTGPEPQIRDESLDAMLGAQSAAPYLKSSSIWRACAS